MPSLLMAWVPKLDRISLVRVKGESGLNCSVGRKNHNCMGGGQRAFQSGADCHS